MQYNNTYSLFFCRASLKKAQKVKHRQDRLEEQAAIVKEYEQWVDKEHDKELKHKQGKIEYKKDLDSIIADRTAREEDTKCQEKVEDEERTLFAEAKKV